MGSVTFNNYGSTSIRAARARQVGTLTLAVTERYQRLWRDAARVFVITVAETIASEIRTTRATGMTVASLRPLGAELRVKNIIVAAFQGFGPKLYGYNYEGKDSTGGGGDLGASHEGPKGNRSKARGEIMGRKAYKINYGTRNRLLMTFDFQAVVYQHLYWLRNGWNDLEIGRIAMIKFLDEKFNDPEYDVAQLIARWFAGGSI